MNFISILLGWPSLILALIMAIIGVARRKPGLLWIALLLNVPMAFYILGSPLYWFAAAAPVVGLSVSAIFARSTHRWPALGGVGLYSAYVFALAGLVFVSPAG